MRDLFFNICSMKLKPLGIGAFKKPLRLEHRETQFSSQDFR
jgi:hypothetical protein